MSTGGAELATIEKRYLAPLNSPIITEADRPKVYDIIGKQLADVLTGNKSYYADGVQKESNARISDLKDFIASIEDLRQRVNDPSNILGKAVDDLGKYAAAFEKMTEKNEPVDNMELPPPLSPNTRDRNPIYVDPDPGPYSPPNPLLPKHWSNDLKASLESSGDTQNASGAAGSGIYSQPTGRAASSVLADNNPPNQPPESYNGNPAQQWTSNNPQAPMFDPTKPPPPFDLSNPYAPFASGNIGNWIRSLADVDPEDPTQFVPPIFSPLYRR
jgi:hypothetical protein